MNELDFSGRKILIIDDKPANLGVMADYLEEFGFEILVSQDGLSGLDLAAQDQPDIILLDVMMPPGIDGFETCRRLKANEQTREIPVIFMTALHEAENKVVGFNAGGVDYVTKPLQQEEVLMRLKTHLQIRWQAQELAEKNAALLALNQSKDKFFSLIAHDLRGPFMPLLGHTELLAENVSVFTPEQLQEIASSMHQATKRVYDLLDNLLEWARLQMDRVVYQPIFLFLADYISECFELLMNKAKQKNIHLSYEVDSNLWVYTDAHMLNTVLRNLITNAIKFTPHNGSVSIVAKPYKKQICLSVIDTGLGIAQQDMPKLFRLDTPHTTLGTNQESGTGLGLIMCYEMVKKQGGEIWAESELGQGAAFHFTLPIWGENIPARPLPALPNTPDLTPTILPTLKIPPPHELQTLIRLTQRGHVSAIKVFLEQLQQADADYKPFIHQVNQLVYRFDEGALDTLLKEYLQQTRP